LLPAVAFVCCSSRTTVPTTSPSRMARILADRQSVSLIEETR